MASASDTGSTAAATAPFNPVRHLLRQAAHRRRDHRHAEGVGEGHHAALARFAVGQHQGAGPG